MNHIELGPTARRVVRFLARFLNPLTLLVAGRGWMPVLGVLEHRGRTSGRTYSTPLGVRRLGDSFVMPLTFSVNAAWYRNVVAAGHCVVRYQGREHLLVQPEVIAYAAAESAFPGYERLQFRLIGIAEFLRMREAPSGWSPSTHSAPLTARA